MYTDVIAGIIGHIANVNKKIFYVVAVYKCVTHCLLVFANVPVESVMMPGFKVDIICFFVFSNTENTLTDEQEFRMQYHVFFVKYPAAVLTEDAVIIGTVVIVIDRSIFAACGIGLRRFQIKQRSVLDARFGFGVCRILIFGQSGRCRSIKGVAFFGLAEDIFIFGFILG